MKFVVRIFIRFYQKVISPPLHALGGPTSGCRFSPTCSQYFLEAVETHGFFRGSCLGVRRICRCHPWGGCGDDPVPPRKGGKSGASSDSNNESFQKDIRPLLSNHHDHHSHFLNHG